MVGFSYVVHSVNVNVAGDITKEVRQSFESNDRNDKAPNVGRKIEIRNDAIYKSSRSESAWRLKYARHKEQHSRGFFSPIAKPYEMFGELQLDLRELVLKTLGAKTKQATINTGKSSLWHKLRNTDFQHLKFDDESNKCLKDEEKQPHMNKKITAMINNRLNVMKNRIARVRARQSYEYCLEKETQRKMLEFLEEQKFEAHFALNTGQTSSYLRKKSVMTQRKSVGNVEDTTLGDSRKLGASELRKYHERKCKNFVAVLKSLYSFICCVYHLKIRDLKTKVPLSREYLKIINNDVSLDIKGKPIRHQRATTTAQNNEGSTDSFHVRSSDSERMTSWVMNESFPNVSRPSAIECSSTVEKQGFGSTKRLKNMGRSGLLEDITEPGNTIGTGQDCQSSRSGISRCSFQGILPSSCTNKRRGHFLGMLTNTGQHNSEFCQQPTIPLWQQISANERNEKKLKPGITRKTEKMESFNLEHLKNAYFETQKECSKRLEDAMKRIEKLEKPVFRTKLEAFKLSHLVENDVSNMRRYTYKLQQDYHDQNVKPDGWFDNLCDRAQQLEVDDDDEVNSQLQKFVPFSKDELETMPHIKSKICLIMQSIPLYELCKTTTREALQFFLDEIVHSSGNTLTDWMAYRKINLPSTKADAA